MTTPGCTTSVGQDKTLGSGLLRSRSEWPNRLFPTSASTLLSLDAPLRLRCGRRCGAGVTLES